jgi:5'-3' exonuclease
VVKILTGDSSDNIDGIFYLGEKTLVKLFPELLEKVIEIPYILNKGNDLLKEEKENIALQNLLSGKTKEGIFGDEFYIINQKLVDLNEPLLSDEDKKLVGLYYSESMDPNGRGHRNLIRMMMEDGFFKYLTKGDDAWVNFLKPFLKLTRKEKNKFKNKKN